MGIQVDIDKVIPANTRGQDRLYLCCITLPRLQRVFIAVHGPAQTGGAIVNECGICREPDIVEPVSGSGPHRVGTHIGNRKLDKGFLTGEALGLEYHVCYHKVSGYGGNVRIRGQGVVVLVAFLNPVTQFLNVVCDNNDVLANGRR